MDRRGAPAPARGQGLRRLRRAVHDRREPRSRLRGAEPDIPIRGIWIQKALEWGQVREYWDDGDIKELEALTPDASAAIERVWRALSVVVETHSAQEDAELGADEDDD